MLAKNDVARAFQNLRVDPVDTFKFGIKWGSKYYWDVALAFDWVHLSASFQMTSDTILYIMRHHNCKIFAYIDNFIILSQGNDAMHHYQALFDIFAELGLPMKQNKMSPHTRTLTCLGITIDLDKNSIHIEKSKIEEIYNECFLTKFKLLLLGINSNHFWANLFTSSSVLGQPGFSSLESYLCSGKAPQLKKSTSHRNFSWILTGSSLSFQNFPDIPQFLNLMWVFHHTTKAPD